MTDGPKRHPTDPELAIARVGARIADDMMGKRHDPDAITRRICPTCGEGSIDEATYSALVSKLAKADAFDASMRDVKCEPAPLESPELDDDGDDSTRG